MTSRRLALVLADTLTDDLPKPVAVNEESANAPGVTHPAPGAISVEPWEVELGDILIDDPSARVAHILWAGTWLYFDAAKVRIASHSLGDTVQVVRHDEVVA